jgi:hypothetical protein
MDTTKPDSPSFFSYHPPFGGKAWYMVLIALVALDLATVAYTLHQHERITSLLDRRAVLDEAVYKQNRAMLRLRAIAIRIDSSSNHVSTSHDATKSRRELHAARSAMSAALTSLRASLTTKPGYVSPMVAQVRQIAMVMDEVAAAGSEVLTALERSDQPGAAAANGRLDAAHARAIRLLDELSLSLDSIEDHRSSNEEVSDSKTSDVHGNEPATARLPSVDKSARLNEC